MRLNVTILCAAALILSACATTAPSSSTIIRTMPPVPAEYRGFTNMLVISVAGDFQSRRMFERNFVTVTADLEGKATGYHTVIGRRPYLTRDALDTVIKSRDFDSILLVREQGQEREALAPGRPVGRAFDLFGYDYAELNSGDSIEQSAAITFIAELYSVAEQKKIWSIESLSFDKATATDLIVEQAATVSQQVIKDRLLRR
ncbi:MAG: hypothetical protein ACR2Q3_17345 [Woeseiaceae bacterium]